MWFGMFLGGVHPAAGTLPDGALGHPPSPGHSLPQFSPLICQGLRKLLGEGLKRVEVTDIIPFFFFLTSESYHFSSFVLCLYTCEWHA